MKKSLSQWYSSPLSLIFILFLSTSFSVAQDNEKSKFDFAKSYIGISSQLLPKLGTTEILSANGIEQIDIPASFQPRLDIGGVHFWGHVDMMGSIPLFRNYNFRDSRVEIGGSTGFSMNIRYYPISLSRKTTFGLRPFVGLKWSELRYWQQVENQERGIELNKQILMLETGSGINIKDYMIDFTVQFLPNHDYSYPISRTVNGKLNYPWLSFKVGAKYLFDFTAINNKEEVKKEVDEFQRFLTDRKALDSWAIGFGFTEVVPVGVSEYKNTSERSFLQNPGPIRIAPEWHLGRYFYHHDWAIRIAGRHIKIYQEGYGFEHVLRRNSISLEAFKFLFDYKGFVPFIGAGYGYNTMELKEWDNGAKVSNHYDEKFASTFFIGWDIRPTRVEWMLIRSHIRWTPWLSTEVNGRELKFNDLEINFLEYVLYPTRLVQKAKFKRI